MNKSFYPVAVVLAIVLAANLYWAQGVASEMVCQKKGQITAIEPAYNTVVVEVPTDGAMFTVGGPLSSGAILKKGGQVVRLTDFLVGEHASVRWRVTEKGHIIQMLEVR
jgi:hypothetical protein